MLQFLWFRNMWIWRPFFDLAIAPQKSQEWAGPSRWIPSMCFLMLDLFNWSFFPHTLQVQAPSILSIMESICWSNSEDPSRKDTFGLVLPSSNKLSACSFEFAGFEMNGVLVFTLAFTGFCAEIFLSSPCCCCTWLGWDPTGPSPLSPFSWSSSASARN